MSNERLEELIPIETGWSEVYDYPNLGYAARILYGIADKGVILVSATTNDSHILVKEEHRGQGVCRAMKEEVWKIYPDLLFESMHTGEIYSKDK